MWGSVVLRPTRGSQRLEGGRRTGAFVLTAVALVALLSAGLLSCGRAEDPAPAPGYVDVGDLADLRKRGLLRVLIPPREVESLPRRGYTLDLERELIQQLATELQLRPVFVTVLERQRMFDDLEQGNGDLAVARLTVTESRQRRFGFSVPIDHVREMLICRKDDGSIAGVEDLAGRQVAVRASSSYAETLRALQQTIPGLQIRTVPESTDTEELLYGVAEGLYDVTVADEDIFLEVSTYLDGLHAPFPLTEEQPVAWAMRTTSVALKQAVDQFLYRQALTQHTRGPAHGDLDAIKERRVLRVLTANTAASYFLYRGEQLGFEFEFVRRFARDLGCRIQMVVPPSSDLLIPWLLEGRGDLVAASMTITPDRGEQASFTRPYNFVSEIVIARVEDSVPESVSDLAGRSIAVRPSSSYHRTLTGLEHAGFEIVSAPEHITTENLIEMVANNEYDLTVADGNILDIELTYRDDVQAAFALGEPKPVAWMARPTDTALLAVANEYIQREYRSAFYNVLKKKYFGNGRNVAVMATERPARQGRISPYDDIFRREARRIEVDWRLLAAQAYQESRFDPQARSWAGAVGIMQVLPKTAAEMGIEGDLTEPEVGIRAGAEYLGWLIDRFSNTLDPAERLRFALAAYNAGRGHILDGRRLAQRHGYDFHVWFDNVERVLPLLSQPEYAGKARFGYCRCSEPVEYVRRIDQRYQAYTRAVN